MLLEQVFLLIFCLLFITSTQNKQFHATYIHNSFCQQGFLWLASVVRLAIAPGAKFPTVFFNNGHGRLLFTITFT